MIAKHKTRSTWEDKGYKHYGSGQCEACSAPVEFFEPPSGGLLVPIDPQTWEAHWASCPKAKEYRMSERMRVGSL